MCPSTAYRKLTHVASKLAGNDHPIEGSFVMKLFVDTSAKNITVSKDPVGAYFTPAHPHRE